MQDEVFLVCWDGDVCRPGGRMIPCRDGEDIDGWGGRAGLECPLGRTSDGRRRGRGGFISKIHNNDQCSLGLEWSLSDVGTSPPHDLDIPHKLVDSNTYKKMWSMN